MLTIKQIKENPKYVLLLDLLRISKKYGHKGLELKEIKTFFDIRHDEILKNTLGNEGYRIPKDEIKEISKGLKTLTYGFNSKQDISNCLRRLKPYVRKIPRTKPSKYYLHDFYHVERLKYAVFEILKSGKKGKILNKDTFEKDQVVKIDIDGISISVPTDKLDFT